MVLLHLVGVNWGGGLAGKTTFPAFAGKVGFCCN